jgi:SAM-dependent methyltransferase
MAAAFADDGAQVIGVDTDMAMLTAAAPRLPGRLLRADDVRLPLADATVDDTVALATLEFTDDPAAVLTEMARITRPGGRVVAATLNPLSPWGWLGNARRHDPYRRARFLSRGDLLSIGGRHGVAQVHGRLFAAVQLPFLAVLGPVLEALGRVLPANPPPRPSPCRPRRGRRGQPTPFQPHDRLGRPRRVRVGVGTAGVQLRGADPDVPLFNG